MGHIPTATHDVSHPLILKSPDEPCHHKNRIYWATEAQELLKRCYTRPTDTKITTSPTIRAYFTATDWTAEPSTIEIRQELCASVIVGQTVCDPRHHRGPTTGLLPSTTFLFKPNSSPNSKVRFTDMEGQGGLNNYHDDKLL